MFDSLKDKSLEGEVFETLKWLAYEKWTNVKKNTYPFKCPHCDHEGASLQYDKEVDKCTKCGGELFLSDMLGFHYELAEEFAPDQVATSYMNVHEVLLLFTGIRYYWENNRAVFKDCLFVKDGPLMLRAQYSKLIAPIRHFFKYVRSHTHVRTFANAHARSHVRERERIIY